MEGTHVHLIFQLEPAAAPRQVPRGKKASPADLSNAGHKLHIVKVTDVYSLRKALIQPKHLIICEAFLITFSMSESSFRSDYMFASWARWSRKCLHEL